MQIFQGMTCQFVDFDTYWQGKSLNGLLLIFFIKTHQLLNVSFSLEKSAVTTELDNRIRA